MRSSKAEAADGSVSASTKSRARGIYGQRIAALKESVDKGDFEGVAMEKNAFILFNSGVYANDKGKQGEAIGKTNEIFAAIRSQDKAALKKAYEGYMKLNEIAEIGKFDTNYGQGFGSDYDFKARTNAGAVYVS